MREERYGFVGHIFVVTLMVTLLLGNSGFWRSGMHAETNHISLNIKDIITVLIAIIGVLASKGVGFIIGSYSVAFLHLVCKGYDGEWDAIAQKFGYCGNGQLLEEMLKILKVNDDPEQTSTYYAIKEYKDKINNIKLYDPLFVLIKQIKIAEEFTSWGERRYSVAIANINCIVSIVLGFSLGCILLSGSVRYSV